MFSFCRSGAITGNLHSFSLTVISISIIALFPEVSLRISKPYHSAQPLEPKIWLSEYMEEDSFEGAAAPKEFKTMSEFENEFVSKNGTDYVITDEGLHVIVFTCLANYPILWTVPEMTQLSGFPHYRISSISGRSSEFLMGMEEPSNKYFKTFLIIWNIRYLFLSATFVCKAAESKATKSGIPMQSNIHIFVNENESHRILENNGETIQVPLDSKANLILPCRPSSPNIPVTLEKQVEEDVWKPFITPSLTFDPKIGFTLKLNRFWRNNCIGLYRCTVNGRDVGMDEDPVVFVDVITHSDPDESVHPLPKLELHQWTAEGTNASVTLRTNAREPELSCCFGTTLSTDQPDKAYYDSCNDPLQCDIMKSNMLLIGIKTENPFILQSYIDDSTNCSTIPLFQPPLVVMCSGKNLDYAGEFTKTFIPGLEQIGNRTAYLLKRIFLKREEYELSSLTIVEDSAKANEASLDKKIFISVGYPPTEEDVEDVGLPSTVLSGRDYANSDLVFDETPEKDEFEKIVEYGRNTYFEGEPLYFMCFGFKYFYSDGARLRINWNNGCWTGLERDLNQETKFVTFYGKVVLDQGSSQITNTFGRSPLTASLEMKSVDCFMPVWNSSKWDKLTYNLSVVASTLPKFLGQSETQYFYVNETEKEISWEIMDGKPPSKINVTKEGKEIPLGDYEVNRSENGSSIIVSIKFGVVSFETHGSFECTASNAKGRVGKTINVIIADNSSAAIYLIVFIVTALLIVLIAIGVTFRFQLEQMWKLQRVVHRS